MWYCDRKTVALAKLQNGSENQSNTKNRNNLVQLYLAKPVRVELSKANETCCEPVVIGSSGVFSSFKRASFSVISLRTSSTYFCQKKR